MRRPDHLGSFFHQRSYGSASSLRFFWLTAFVLNTLALVFFVITVAIPAAASQNELVNFLSHATTAVVVPLMLISIIVSGMFVKAIEKAIKNHQANKLALLGLFSLITWVPSVLLLVKLFFAGTGASGTMDEHASFGAALALSFLLLFTFYFLMAVLFTLYSLATVISALFVHEAERYYSNNLVVHRCTMADVQDIQSWYLALYRGKFEAMRLTSDEAWALLGLSKRTLSRCSVIRHGNHVIGFALTDRSGTRLEALEVTPLERGLGYGATLLIDFYRTGKRRKKHVMVDENNRTGQAFLSAEGLTSSEAVTPDGKRRYVWS